MNEVSCRVFEIYQPVLAAKGIALTDVVAGTNVPVATLTNKSDRIDWADFVAISNNLRPHFTDEERVALGRSYMTTHGLRFVFVIARLALTPIDVYRWMNQPRQGFGNQMFTCVVPHYQEISANELVIELTLPEGFEPCRDFFVISRGTLENLPQLFGLPPAKVVLTPIPRGGRYEVTVPMSRVPLFQRARRWFEWPFAVRAAARELKEAHDVLTEVQHRRDEYAARLKQAEQLTTLAILTSGFAHQLRNPADGIVNAIEPLVELLPKDVAGPETGAGQLLEVMSECAEQLSVLSRQLLAFERKQELELIPTDASEVVERGLLLAQRSLTGVDVRTSYESDQTIACSKPLLAHALLNLIENAGHAVGPGGWVHVATRTSGNAVQIEVTDSGCGVPTELRDRIFEPFFTTKAPGEGIGLGLSVSRAIVRLHRGVLEIRERGGRSSFVVEIPAVPADEEQSLAS